MRAVLKFFPVTKSGWWAGVKGGRYPQPVHLGLRIIGWRTSDILKLIEGVSRKGDV